MSKFRYLFVVCVFFMSSCAHNAALTKGQDKVDFSKNSIALMSVKIANQYQPDYQLEIAGTFICPQHQTCMTRP